MKSKIAGKVKLTSFDDLFGTGEAAAGETVTSVPGVGRWKDAGNGGTR